MATRRPQKAPQASDPKAESLRRLLLAAAYHLAEHRGDYQHQHPRDLENELAKAAKEL